MAIVSSIQGVGGIIKVICAALLVRLLTTVEIENALSLIVGVAKGMASVPKR